MASQQPKQTPSEQRQEITGVDDSVSNIKDISKATDDTLKKDKGQHRISA